MAYSRGESSGLLFKITNIYIYKYYVNLTNFTVFLSIGTLRAKLVGKIYI